MTEKELIENCQRRDPKYQRQLVDQYSSVLMATCMRYCKHADDAKDCLQEAWINIFKALHKYQPTGSFKAWMQRIAINCALTHYRKSASIIRIESNKEARPINQAPSVYGTMQADDIMKLIDQLTEIKKMVFTLNIIDGFKHAEIAEKLDITESTSRSILTRARQEIKKMIVTQDKVIEL